MQHYHPQTASTCVRVQAFPPLSRLSSLPLPHLTDMHVFVTAPAFPGLHALWQEAASSGFHLSLSLDLLNMPPSLHTCWHAHFLCFSVWHETHAGMEGPDNTCKKSISQLGENSSITSYFEQLLAPHTLPLETGTFLSMTW